MSTPDRERIVIGENGPGEAAYSWECMLGDRHIAGGMCESAVAAFFAAADALDRVQRLAMQEIMAERRAARTKR